MANIKSKKNYKGDNEYYLKESPSKTVIGKIILIVILVGMGVLPVVSLLIYIFQAL